MKLFLRSLLLTTLLKGLVWVGFVPMWHFPDEHAHLAQVAYYWERKQLTNPKAVPDLNEEINLTEKILGTERDYRGNNKFTFHPEYNIAYTDTTIGQFEEQIRHIPLESRKVMVKREATFYPPLYYLLALVPYGMFYGSSLIERVFATRLLSLILMLLLVVFNYKSFQIVFRMRSTLSAAATLLVAFHPMLSFVGSGVNSDVLFNVVFSAGIYLGLLILSSGLKWNYVLLLIGLSIVATNTKPQGYILPFLFILPLAVVLFQANLRRKFMMIAIGIATLLLLRDKISNFLQGKQYLPDIPHHKEPPLLDISLWKYSLDTLRHTIREVIPWYWGVFKWLGVTYPRFIHRLLNRIMLAASIGFFFYIINFFRRKLGQKDIFYVLFLIYASVIYFVAISIFDFLFIRSHGFSLGVQGRYFFPVVTAQLGLFLIGLTSFSNSPKWQTLIAKLTGSGMIALHFLALYTVTSSYYDVSSVKTLFTQASQYKPVIFKSPFLEFYLSATLLSSIITWILFLRLRSNGLIRRV